MVRIALAAYMLLLSLMGPNPCCCALSRFIAWQGTGTRAVEDRDASLPSCCQGHVASDSNSNSNHDRTVESDGELGGRESESSSPWPSERCRCSKSDCEALPPPSSELTVELARSWVAEMALHYALPASAHVGELVEATARHARDADPARPSGREMRIQLSSWRC